MAFTKYTGTVTGETGSLITALDAALVTGEGWTKEYTDTSKAVYRAPSGNRFYFRVRDDGPNVTSTYKEAWLRGYETMTDVDTGSALFPTAAQNTNGLVARKSAAADSTARSYKIFADHRTCYVFIQTGDSAGIYLGFAFGEFYSFLANDSYRSFIIGRPTENSSSVSLAGDPMYVPSVAAGTIQSGCYIARSYAGTGGAVQAGILGMTELNSGLAGYVGSITYPNPADAGLYLFPINIFQANVLRGRMRGFWQMAHAIANFTDGDTFSGTGDLAGRTFEIVKGPSNGVYVIETSDTLETN